MIFTDFRIPPLSVRNVSLLRSFATNSASQLDVFRHNGNSLCMYRTKVSILKETNQVRFRGLLQCENRIALESQLSPIVLSNFTDQSLKRELPNQKLGRLLVLADFTKRNCSGTIAMWFLYATWTMN